MSKIKIGDCYHFGKELLVVDHLEEGIPYCIMDGKPEMVQVADIPLPTLHLPIGNDAKKYGGCWFDMILSGVKKEEYRELSNHYQSLFKIQFLQTTMGKDYYSHCDRFPYKVLHLTNGYNPKNQQLWAHIESITIGRGKPEWGAPTDRDVFIIKIGQVFHTKNLK